jgi:hypothetical protein
MTGSDVTQRRNAQAPCIIFIDEVDAIGTKRFDSDLSGDREVQRTMLELLNQLDGFSSDDRIKVRHGHVTRIYRCVLPGGCARSGTLAITIWAFLPPGECHATPTLSLSAPLPSPA